MLRAVADYLCGLHCGESEGRVNMLCPCCMEEHETKIMWKKDVFLGVEYDYEYTFCETAKEGYLTEQQFARNYARWKKAKGEE